MNLVVEVLNPEFMMFKASRKSKESQNHVRKKGSLVFTREPFNFFKYIY